MNRIRAIARTVIRVCFRTGVGISLILIGAVSFVFLVLIFDGRSEPSKEDRIFELKIYKAFEGRKELVAIKDIFPEDWDHVCMNWDYARADRPIRRVLKLSEKDHLQFSTENIYFDENERGLIFVKKISQNNYEVAAHKYTGSLVLEMEGREMCLIRDSAHLKLSFVNNNFMSSSLIFIDKRSYND